MPLNTLDCPRCGAPLDPPVPAGPTMECPYCKNTVVIPDSVRSKAGAEALQNPAFARSAAPDLARLAELGKLVRSGRKIEAIKLVREMTPLGLKEAKDLVEAMERGEPVQLPTTSFQTTTLSASEYLANSSPSEVPPGLEAELRALLQQNQRTAAIRLLRERMDLSLSVADTTLAMIALGTPLPQALAQAGWKAAVQRTAAGLQPVRVDLHSAEFNRTALKAAGASAAGCSALSVFIILVGVLLPLGVIALALLAPSGPWGEFGSRINPFAFARNELAFGTEGEGQGMFTDLRNVAPASDGSVYTAEYETGRVQHFDAQGKFLNLWFIPPAENQNDVYISDLEAGPNGLVYVLVQGDIMVYDGNAGVLQGTVRAERDGRKLYLDDLAFGPDGVPYALGDSETLVRFDVTTEPCPPEIAALQGSLPNCWLPVLLREKIISAITKDSESTSYLALDGSGFVYILGYYNYSVFKYDRDGAYLNRFGSEGEKPGEFTSVDDLAIDGYGRVFVSDMNGINVFDSGGKILRRFDIPGVAFDLSIDGQNRLWVASNNQRIIRYVLSAP